MPTPLGLICFLLAAKSAPKATNRTNFDAAATTLFVQEWFFVQVANDTIILLIGLVYCVIQPIIAPLALIHFAVGVLIWKYQVVYVYVPFFESGGKV